ncbi:PREDICTED: uncharacterized protein LOC109487471 [Branchiostoma belcheri]|uniref:Uncharacterized protein LOC109487471 n=1 Tax=Branchiostoma belcheri TaxID=7741 RepID=A0A6P5A126_BRABE|nr:PREDICTED: uncharacterized protein LOC109487471 [Branchiostoma belcheri]
MSAKSKEEAFSGAANDRDPDFLSTINALYNGNNPTSGSSSLPQDEMQSRGTLEEPVSHIDTANQHMDSEVRPQDTALSAQDKITPDTYEQQAQDENSFLDDMEPYAVTYMETNLMYSEASSGVPGPVPSPKTVSGMSGDPFVESPGNTPVENRPSEVTRVTADNNDPLNAENRRKTNADDAHKHRHSPDNLLANPMYVPNAGQRETNGSCTFWRVFCLVAAVVLVGATIAAVLAVQLNTQDHSIQTLSPD